MLLFSYGSNCPDQLGSRLGRRILGARRAYVVGHARVFRGWSMRWRGGVASLEPMAGSVTFGYVAPVSEGDLSALDAWEGVGLGRYRRIRVTACLGDEGDLQAVAYAATSPDFARPSREYLEAVARTVAGFWTGVNGPPGWADIPVR